jgi:hypothetical protein
VRPSLYHTRVSLTLLIQHYQHMAVACCSKHLMVSDAYWIVICGTELAQLACCWLPRALAPAVVDCPDNVLLVQPECCCSA